MNRQIAVVVGNPRPASRTLAAARFLVRQILDSEPDLVIDLATVGASLLDWSDPTVTELVHRVGAADLVVVASPTYKGTYTGLLKLFLDRFAGQTGIGGVAVPFMLGGSPAHTLAAELTLRPVLAELGACIPVRGLYVVDKDHDDPAAYADWLTAARPTLTTVLTALEGVRP